MHTEEECIVKIKGIKILATQIKLEIKERGCAFNTADSILQMCDELLREFSYDNEE